MGVKCSSCRVRGQKSKLSYRHVELGAFKKQNKITRNAQACSLFSLSSWFSGSDSRSVVSNSLRPHGLWPASVVCSWDFPGKNTGVGCLLHGIFPTQGLNQHLLCWQMDSLPLSHQVSYTWPISSFSVTHLILVQYLHLGFCGLQKMTVKHDKRYVWNIEHEGVEGGVW